MSLVATIPRSRSLSQLNVLLVADDQNKDVSYSDSESLEEIHYKCFQCQANIKSLDVWYSMDFSTECEAVLEKLYFCGMVCMKECYRKSQNSPRKDFSTKT